jgi:hypothetical protein
VEVVVAAVVVAARKLAEGARTLAEAEAQRCLKSARVLCVSPRRSGQSAQSRQRAA